MKPFWLSLLVLPTCLSACSTAANINPIVVEWKTGSEVNTAGFNLYRATSAEGPFVKINADLIPASNDAIAGGKYRYEDANVISGQTYYYQLEDVEFSGASAKHGPITITASSAWQTGGAIAMIAALSALIAVGGGMFFARRRG